MIKLLKWASTVLLVFGALLISLNIPESRLAFPAFFLGHSILVIVFLKERDIAIVVQMIFFWALDILALYRWFYV
jgi:hypothetical protein